MTIQMLECFLTVVKKNSFSLAAEELYMSQPTLSRQISALEDSLNVKLFIRSKNTVRLSPIGEVLYDKLELLFQDYNHACQDIFMTINAYLQHLSVGVLEGVEVEPTLKAAFQQLKHQFPQGQIAFSTLEPTEILAALNSGAIDLLLAYEIFLPSAGQLDHLVLRNDLMCAAVPAEHPNANIKRIFYDELNLFFGDLPLMLGNNKIFASPIQPVMEARRDEFHISAELVDEKNSVASLLRMVEMGLAVSFFPEHSTLQNYSSVRLIPIYLRRPGGTATEQRVQVVAAWNRENNSAMLKALIKELKRQLSAQTE